MKQKLLPCPHCGGKADFEIGSMDPDPNMTVQCQECGASGPTVFYWSEDGEGIDEELGYSKAARVWNTRHKEPQ